MKWRKVSIQKIASLLLVLVLLFPSTVPALAAKVTPPRPDKMPPSSQLPRSQRWIQNVERKRAYEDAIRKMEAHLFVGKDGLLHLDVASAQAIGVPQPLFRTLRAALEETNTRIKKGELKLGDVALSNGRNLLGHEAPIYKVSENPPAIARSCAGWTGVRIFWYGPRIYLDECVTDQVVNLLNVGAGAGAVAAAMSAAGIVDIPYSALVGLGSAMAWLGGAWIHEVDSWGGYRGTYWQLTWWWGLNWWWHQ